VAVIDFIALLSYSPFLFKLLIQIFYSTKAL